MSALETAQRLMALLDDKKDELREGEYLSMANLLCDVVGNRIDPRARSDFVSSGVWLSEGDFVIPNEHLLKHLRIHIPTERLKFNDKDLVFKFLGRYEHLPNDVNLDTLLPATVAERHRRGAFWENLRLRTDGPYFRFASNWNINWILYGGQIEHLESADVWLEPWMLNMLSDIVTDSTPPDQFDASVQYVGVVTYPQCYGWSRPRFRALERPTVSLFERFQDDKSAEAGRLQSKLPKTHPLRWVGVHRGLQFGFLWKHVRGMVKTFFIAQWWKRRCLKRNAHRAF